MKLRRIDFGLVRHKLARSRTHVREMIAKGRTRLDREVVTKPTRQMDPAQTTVIAESRQIEYVLRRAHKLADALDSLGKAAPIVKGCRCLDAGTSTSGFTDVLLRRGAASVVATDVDYGQLAWRLQPDPRVEVRDRTNARIMKVGDVGPVPSLVMGSMSFISFTLVISALVAAAAENADFLLIVKPQFEIGKERLGHEGVVRNPEYHVETVESVVRCAMDNGLGIFAIEASPPPGPPGNVEYFLRIRAGDSDAIASEELHLHIEGVARREPADGREDTQ